MRPPATCPLCQYSCPNVVKWCQNVTPWRHMTSWRQAVTSHDVLFHNKKALCNLHSSHHENMSENRIFLNFDLDLWPWPSNSSEKLSKAMSMLNFRSVAQTVQPWERWQTDKRTDGTDFIPCTADARGKNGLIGLLPQGSTSPAWLERRYLLVLWMGLRLIPPPPLIFWSMDLRVHVNILVQDL